MWLSHDGWVDDVTVWAGSPDLAAVCASLGVSIAPATVVSVAVAWAGYADHGTGRNAAVTRARIAEHVGCAIKTVSRVWQVLRAAGFAVEAARGHGSSTGHTAGNRPSIWHLVSRKTAAGSVENVPLPPSRRDGWVSPVERRSPSTRERAREGKSSPKQARPPRSRRRWRATPRPLAVQRLAAGLVTPAVGHGTDNDGRRTALVAGLERNGGHIGAICDAITAAGIDAAAWTPKTLTAALNADMRAAGWSWPDRIERPGAFLAWRLRRLPARPDRSGRVDGGTAAGLEQPRRAPGEPSAARTAPVQTIGPEPVQTAAGRAYARELFAAQRRGRSADAAPPWPVAVRVRQSAPHGRHDAPESGVCATCGCADAPRRRFLPAQRSHVCDGCWDGAPVQAGV